MIARSRSRLRGTNDWGGVPVNSIPIRHKWEPYLWLLPSLLLMSIFVVFPIGIVFKLS